MRTLVIATTRNKIGRHDGDTFKAEAQRFCELHHGDPLYYRLELPGKRRRLCDQFLRSAAEIGGRVDAVAIFGHGGARDLYCTGHGVRHIPELADSLLACLRLDRPVYVVLYACLTASGFGFADRLDAALEGRGLDVRTIAHTTAGHTSWNPYTEDAGEGPSCRGVPLIQRASHLWPEWVRRLRTDRDSRLSFWQLTPEQLAIELGDTPPPRMPPLPERVKNQV